MATRSTYLQNHSSNLPHPSVYTSSILPYLINYPAFPESMPWLGAENIPLLATLRMFLVPPNNFHFKTQDKPLVNYVEDRVNCFKVTEAVMRLDTNKSGAFFGCPLRISYVLLSNKLKTFGVALF